MIKKLILTTCLTASFQTLAATDAFLDFVVKDAVSETLNLESKGYILTQLRPISINSFVIDNTNPSGADSIEPYWQQYFSGKQAYTQAVNRSFNNTLCGYGEMPIFLNNKPDAITLQQTENKPVVFARITCVPTIN